MSDKFEMMDDEAKSLATRIAYRYASNHSWLCEFLYDYNTLIDMDRYYCLKDKFCNQELHYGEDTVLLVAAFLVRKNAVVVTDVEKSPYFGEAVPILQSIDPGFGILKSDAGIVKISIEKLEKRNRIIDCYIYAPDPPPADFERLKNLKEDIQFILQPADYVVRDNEKYKKWMELGREDHFEYYHWCKNSSGIHRQFEI